MFDLFVKWFIDCYLWVPTISLIYVLYAYVSHRANNGTTWWFLATILVGMCCPFFWSVVSRYSKRIYFDGMLFDVVVFMAYAITIAVVGRGDSFSTRQWIGVIVVTIGFILMAIPKEII